MVLENDFDVAKAVSDLLKDLPGDRQARIMKWVSESLGIAAPNEQRQHAFSSHQGAPSADRAPSLSASTDIKSFIAAKEPRSDNQFAAAVAYYYRFQAPHDQRTESITSEHLQEATRLSGRSRLGDPGKTLRNAKDMGYLDAAERGEFKINTVGENLVAMTLPSQARVTKTKVARRKGRATKKS